MTNTLSMPSDVERLQRLVAEEKEGGFAKRKTLRMPLLSLVSLGGYKFVLDLSYALIIPNIRYYGVPTYDLSKSKLLESYLLGLALFAVMPKSSRKPSTLLTWLLVLLSYIPMLTVYAFQNESRAFMYSATVFWLGVFFLVRHVRDFRFRSMTGAEARIAYRFVFAGTVIVSLLLIYGYLGFNLYFDLSKVYAFRARFAESGMPLHGLFLHWVASFILPVFLARFIIRKQRIFAGMTIFVDLLVAAAIGQKFYYFLTPYTLVLLWVFTKRRALDLLGLFLTVIVLIGLADYYLIYDNLGYLFGTVRWLLLPAELNFFYYGFFSTHPYVFFGHIWKFTFGLRPLLDYPYNLYPANLIGAVYFGMPNAVAVTGLLGDAYMNLGFIGLGLWAIALTLILKLLDRCASGLDLRLAIAAIAMPSVSLVGTFFERATVVYGLVPALFFLYLLSSGKRSLQNSVQPGPPSLLRATSSEDRGRPH